MIKIPSNLRFLLFLPLNSIKFNFFSSLYVPPFKKQLLSFYRLLMKWEKEKREKRFWCLQMKLFYFHRFSYGLVDNSKGWYLYVDDCINAVSLEIELCKEEFRGKFLFLSSSCDFWKSESDFIVIFIRSIFYIYLSMKKYFKFRFLGVKKFFEELKSFVFKL